MSFTSAKGGLYLHISCPSIDFRLTVANVPLDPSYVGAHLRACVCCGGMGVSSDEFRREGCGVEWWWWEGVRVINSSITPQDESRTARVFNARGRSEKSRRLRGGRPSDSGDRSFKRYNTHTRSHTQMQRQPTNNTRLLPRLSTSELIGRLCSSP